MNIDTSAALVRRLFRKSIELGRQFARNGNKNDLYEALRLLGTGCHCLEDYSAHSNYTELALIELGEEDVFPHVGRDTKIQLPGARKSVYPIVTGTFGGTDFLHSVMGEFSDKATQSEIQELEGTMQQYQRQDEAKSVVQDLLNKLPSSLFGGKDEAGKADELQQNAQAAQMANTQISPREPEEWANYISDCQKQIYPILEWHDEIMKTITETIDQIPVLPELIEQIQDQINVFVFSLLAPFVLPIIRQVKAELSTGSAEIIKSSEEQQHIVFNDDNCSDPTHSMLSKDHFSNILNEPAGKVASQVLKWVVPQLIQAWDDESVDIRRLNDRIIHAVFHHPAQRGQGDDGVAEGRRLMFKVVENWWNEKSEREKSGTRDQLSRDGVEAGRNHKEGVHDSGHGCGKPLGMTKLTGGSGGQSSAASNQIGSMASEAVGGGALGGLVGGLVGGVGASLLGGAFGSEEKKTTKQSYGDTTTYTQTAHHKKQSNDDSERYGQAQYSQTQDGYGGGRQEYSSTVTESYGGSSNYQSHTESTYQTSSYGGGGQQSYGEQSYGEQSYGKKQHKKKKNDSDDSEDDDEDDWKKKEKKREKEKRKEEEHRRKKSHEKNDSDDERRGGGYGGGRQQEYEQPSRYGGGREEYGGGRQEEYGRPQRDEFGGGPPGGFGRDEGFGGGRRHEEGGFGGGYGRQEEQEGFGRGGHGREEGFGGGREEFGGGRPSGFGGGREEFGGGPPGGFGEDEGGFGGGQGRRGPPGGFGDEGQYEGGGGYGGGYGGGRY